MKSKVYKMVFKEIKFKQSWRIGRNILSRKIICGKGNLFLLKSCVFSVYVLLAFLALK